MASSSQERCQTCQLTLGRTRKSITHRSTRWGGGGRGSWNASQEVLICCSFSKRFRRHWKAFDLLNKRQKNFRGGFVQIFLKFDLEINSFFLVT